MATLARLTPSPGTFLSEPWSSFVGAAQLRLVDYSPLKEFHGELVNEEEMLHRRLFPVLEDFHLVVCHVCNQVVTPQAFLTHYEKRHSSPVPSRSPLVLMKAKAPAAAPAVGSGPEDALAFRIPKDYPHSRFSKAPLAVYPPKGARSKSCVSLPVVSLEKIPCLSRANSTSQVRLAASSSSPSSSPLKHPALPAAAFSKEKIPNGRGSAGPSTPRSSASPSSLDTRTSPARSPPERRPASSLSPSPAHRSSSQLSSLSPSEKKNQNGTKASSRSHNRLSGRVFDPNKHCGVQDPETKQPCTRSLTCKTHSLTHRRAVPGRRKHFDLLLAEHRGRTKEKEKDKDGCSPSVGSQDVASPSKSHCPNGRALSSLKLKLASAHIPRVPGITTSAPQLPPPAPFPVPGPFSVPASDPEHSPQPWTATGGGDGERLSSDEGDAHTPEDAHAPVFHFSKVHPQPSGFCIFSSRLMGRGHYVFDRRWDRMRLTLQNMVEKHLNAQMWRKVPLAAESLASLSPSGVTSQRAALPSPASDTRLPLTASSGSVSCGTSFPHPASLPRSLTFRDTPQPVSTLGASQHSAHRAGRSTKEREDSFAGAKRKYSSYSCSFRNWTSNHPPSQGSGGPDATPARKKGHGREGNGLWSYSDHWLSKADCSRGHNSNNSDLGNTGISYPSSRELTAAPSSGALNYGQKAEGRKRKSDASYEGKTGNKLNRLGGVDGFFGNGNDSESQRQAKLHH